MADIIQLLPDAIANQIAAGEVIQRPSSAVKELLENAIDAGAVNIQLILKEAGKTLIQVIDDGCGMSATDARMSFERHATSKIQQAKDLFNIRTMGFRGEALASIAAIAQIEMKTRQAQNDLGTQIIIEGSEVKKQEPCQCPTGTSFSIKNLFYNVPARRNFLKSNAVEMRHILDEFQRIALANPDIHFSLHHNDNEIHHLPAGNQRQRIVSLFGSSSNKKLVPIEEHTDIIKIDGYIGKPEFSKKTRGEQFFFVNRRFIKSGYLHHALMSAYENLLPKDTYPLYVIFIDIDPNRIDINVHPTKQEIKFEDERLIYNYLKVAVRHALGQHSVTPMLDFDQNVNFGSSPNAFSGMSNKSSQPKQTISNAPSKKPSALEQSNLKNWQKLYDGLGKNDDGSVIKTSDEPLTISSSWSSDEGVKQSEQDDPVTSQVEKHPYQIHNTYVISHIKSGYLLIDQQAAHERILYERYLEALSKQEAFTQKELFPKTISVSAADSVLMKKMLPEINKLGFDIKEFGKNDFVIHGIPASLNNEINEQQLIEQLIEQYKINVDLNLNINENIASSLAKSAAIKRGQRLNVAEMKSLIDKLFACAQPYQSPNGRKCFITYKLDEIEKLMK